jgi:hypothetical protein
MVVAQKNGKHGYKGYTEIYKRIKLLGGAKETTQRSPISGNRNKSNSKRNDSRAYRGYDENLRPAQDVKLLPHDGHYSQHHLPNMLDNRRKIPVTSTIASFKGAGKPKCQSETSSFLLLAPPASS